ncbi:MAG: hypothetical protein QXZ31_03820 [Thermofilaceae archaeon]
MSEDYQRVYVSSPAYESVRVIASVEGSVATGATSISATGRSEGAGIVVQAVSASNYSVESSPLQVTADYPVYVHVSQPQASSDSRALSSAASGRSEYSIESSPSHVTADSPVYAQVSRSQSSSDSGTLTGAVSGRSEYSVVQEPAEAEAVVPGAIVAVEEASGISHPQGALQVAPVIAVDNLVEPVEEVIVEHSEAGPAIDVQEFSVSDSAPFTAVPNSVQAYEYESIGLREVVIEHTVSVVHPIFVEESPTTVIKFTLDDLLKNAHLLDAFLKQAPDVLRETLIAMGFSDAPGDLKALLDYYWSTYNTYCTIREPVFRDVCRQLDLVKGIFDATKFIYEHHAHLRRVEQLLADAQKGDAWSVGRNPAFRALVKVYEILPAISDTDLRNALLGNLGLSNPEELQQLLRKIARGEQLNDKEIMALMLASKLYDEKWEDFKKYGNFSLAVEQEMESLDPNAYNQLVMAAIMLMNSGESIYYTDLSKIPANVADAYYAAVLLALREGGGVDHREHYLANIQLREKLTKILKQINVLGHFSSAVSSAIKSVLTWFGVDEKTAEKVAMFGASGVVSFTLGAVNAATGGLATPVILGLAGLSGLSAFAQVGTLADTPVEREFLVNALKADLPWIAASIGAAVLAGYGGAKLGAVVEKNVTLPLLVKMYNKALDSGHHSLADKIRGFLENKLSQYTAIARLKAEDYEFNLYVDERGEVVVQLAAKGRWELVHTSKSLSNDLVAVLQDQQSREVLGGIVRQVIPEIKSSKESVERFLSNLNRLASDALVRGGPAATRDVLILIRDALKDARVLDVLKTNKVLRVVPTPSGAVVDTDAGAYVLVRAPGSVEPYVIFTSKSNLEALQLYSTLRDAGVNINEFISVASRYSGAGSWAARIGELDVIFSEGKLVIVKEGSKLAEVMLVDRVLKNLPGAVEIAESLQKAGVPYTIIRAVSQTYASGGIVPSAAPADVALPVADLYQSIAEALRGQGVIGARSVAMTTSKGVITVNYAWYVGADDAKAFEEAVKVLSTESMKNVAKTIVQNKLGAELGKGGVLYSYVLTVPADKSEQLSNVLMEALNRVYSLVKTGKIVEASQVTSMTLTSVEAVAGKEATQVVGQMLLQALMLASEGRQIVFTVPATVSSTSAVYIPVVLAATGATTALTEQVAQAKTAASSSMLSAITQTMASRGLLSLSFSKISEYDVTVAQGQLERVFASTITGTRTQATAEPRNIKPEVSTGASHSLVEVPTRKELELPKYQATTIPQVGGDPRRITPVPEPVEEHMSVEVPTRKELELARHVPGLYAVPVEEPREVTPQLVPRSLYQTEAVEVSSLVTVTDMKKMLNLEGATSGVTVIPIAVEHVVEVPVPLIEIPGGPPTEKEPPPPQAGLSSLPLAPRLEFAPGMAALGGERYKHVFEEVVI